MTTEKCDSGFIQCSHLAVGECSMCGRLFCLIHGSEEEGVCRSCFTSHLARKAADIARAEDIATREQAASRNDRNLCGAEGCNSSSLVHYCQRCANWFCGRHVRKYSYRTAVQTITGPTTTQEEIALCIHCAPHLRDYEKEQF